MKGYVVRKHRNHRIYLGSIGDGYHVVVHSPSDIEVERTTVHGTFRDAIKEGKAIIDEHLKPNGDQEDLFDDAFDAMCQAVHKEGWP